MAQTRPGSAAPATSETPRHAMIECISDRRPWAGGRPLARNERAMVPAEEARLLVERELARKV